jgi:hypothetical protein
MVPLEHRMLQFGGVLHPAALHTQVSQILLAVLVDLTDRRAAAESPPPEVIMMTTMPMSITTTGRSS